MKIYTAASNNPVEFKQHFMHTKYGAVLSKGEFALQEQTHPICARHRNWPLLRKNAGYQDAQSGAINCGYDRIGSYGTGSGRTANESVIQVSCHRADNATNGINQDWFHCIHLTDIIFDYEPKNCDFVTTRRRRISHESNNLMATLGIAVGLRRKAVRDAQLGNVLQRADSHPCCFDARTACAKRVFSAWGMALYAGL